MKNRISIFFAVLTTFSFMAFAFVNWSNTEEIDLVYNVDSRFMATITKEDLYKATSVVDIVPEEAEWSKVSFLNMTVAILQDDGEATALGENEMLNATQTKLLKSADYSTNFYVKGKGKRKGIGPEGLKNMEQEIFDFAYYLTIVPEKEAEYTAGYDALISYLKEKSKVYTTNITEDKIEFGRINFMITKSGTMDHVTIESTSGYPSFDEALVELVSSIPGKWNPATNLKGEKVDQEFVFFFGKIGC